ncbi:SpoIIE family protein phosphatase [Roseateles amylovorans]|uniref:SpoIIE family protein phosphatase n=1 Tax=Roseateles amylovorans TaxID=2978473 RepID=A0ABY6B6A2_9BURK|nr:SpoIIE family protein phosphatase [Roseateles amylovorans]UXH80562.1 SpoIIE family protein phosphatase [Roseateles amylovorans]
MRPHVRFAIEDISQVGEARRAAHRLAQELAFDEAAAGRLALIVTELGTNLVRHVGPGRQAALLIGVDEACDLPAPTGEARRGVSVLSLDQGPGMDLDRCLRDGYSTGGTSGTGLGAVRRMARRFGAYSAPGRGTVIAAQAAADTDRSSQGASPTLAQGPFDIAGLSLAAPGETVSGDAWTLRRLDDRWLLMLADGLGHGIAAAEAADRVVELTHQSSCHQPAAMLEDAHDRMRSTRGAAVAAVAMEIELPRLHFAGAGNIAGRLISGVSDRTLLSQHGTLGVQVRRLQDVAYDWPAHAVLVLHSDGIITRWHLEDTPGLLQSDPAVIAGWILRDHLRGRDDATVVVARRHLSPPARPTATP